MVGFLRGSSQSSVSANSFILGWPKSMLETSTRISALPVFAARSSVIFPEVLLKRPRHVEIPMCENSRLG